MLQLRNSIENVMVKYAANSSTFVLASLHFCVDEVCYYFRVELQNMPFM
jgi:hypothetical protein